MQLVRVDRPGPQLEEAKALLVEYWKSFGFTPCFQGFDQELAALPGDYAPPRGALLLAPGRGCVAVRPLDAETAEMKQAVALYRSMGFRDAAPYLPEPTPGALCLELTLR